MHNERLRVHMYRMRIANALCRGLALLCFSLLNHWVFLLLSFTPFTGGCIMLHVVMKSTKVQNPRHKCSAVVETNCLVAEYRILYRIGPRTIITHAHHAPLIDGLGHSTWSAT